MHRPSLASLVAAFVALSSAAAPALTVALDPTGAGASEVHSLVDDGAGSSIDVFELPDSIPAAGAPAATDGPNASTTAYSFTVAGFEISFEHARDTALWGISQSYGDLYFSPSENVGYALDGSYASNAPGPLATIIHARLVDYTASNVLFQNMQVSYETPGEAFALGASGGDTYNDLSGSLTGTLLAGHTYYLRFEHLIHGYPEAPVAPAQASGYLRLTFVPEPGTAVLIGIGLAATVAFRGGRTMRRSRRGGA